MQNICSLGIHYSCPLNGKIIHQSDLKPPLTLNHTDLEPSDIELAIVMIHSLTGCKT